MSTVDRIIALSRGEKPKGPETKTAKDLRREQFAPLKYIVPGLIVEGLVLLAGKPKVRKSWMGLDISLAVALSRLCLGDRKPQQGSVLFLGLEDGERRLQRRIDKLLPTFGAEWPENFEYATKWPRADQGGVEAIDAWCEKHPDARLVVIDVLARFRAPANSRANAYTEDYAALAKLQELAVRRAITILVIHHTRKGDSEDPVEEISGTLGLTGCADAFLVLKRTTAGSTLIGRGRDSDDVDLAIQFNDATCRWTILGETSEVHQSDQRAAVVTALKSAPEGLSTSEIISVAGLVSRTAADKLLLRMVEDDQVVRIKRGLFGLRGVVKSPPSPRLREKREKGRLKLKPFKEQEDKGQSPNLPHLPEGGRMEDIGPSSPPPTGQSQSGGHPSPRSTNGSQMPPMPKDGDAGDAHTPTHSNGHTCAQCGAADGTEQEHTIDGKPIWLHEQCERFWRAGDAWGRR
jgi:hypothetical protein